jgi:CRP/FNR family transcriptional regulator, cyclic AMP receptor protein
MLSHNDRSFDLRAVLTASLTPFTVDEYRPKEIIFSQGDPSDSVMYIENGSVQLTVLARCGKEAIVGLLGRGAFLGEDALAGRAGRLETATTASETTVITVAKADMLERLHTQPALWTRFIGHVLARNIRLKADLTDQLVNFVEKRVARTLLLLAGYGERDRPNSGALRISQGAIAEMVGTTRSRVNVFMNKFKRLGFIEYQDGLKINPSLLKVVAHDESDGYSNQSRNVDLQIACDVRGDAA